MRLADELGAASVAFPSISTGVYGYPQALAGDVAVRTLTDALASASSVRRVTMVAYGADSASVLVDALRRASPAA